MAITRFINPSTMSKPIGFAHVVDITGPGRTIYIAGQCGANAVVYRSTNRGTKFKKIFTASGRTIASMAMTPARRRRTW